MSDKHSAGFAQQNGRTPVYCRCAQQGRSSLLTAFRFAVVRRIDKAYIILIASDGLGPGTKPAHDLCTSDLITKRDSRPWIRQPFVP